MIDLVASYLIVSGASKLTGAKELRKAVIDAAFILAVFAFLDVVGLYSLVPMSAFLMLLGASKPLKLNKRDLAVLVLYYAFAYIDPIKARDNWTCYYPVAYYIVTHDPYFEPVEVHNIVADGLAASTLRLLLPLKIKLDPLASRSARAFLSLLKYAEERLGCDRLCVLAFLSVPYRAMELVYNASYLDPLYVIIVIEAFDLGRPLGREALALYVSSKQSRPFLVSAVALYYILPRRRPLIGVLIVSLAALSILRGTFLFAIPALLVLARYRPKGAKMRAYPSYFLLPAAVISLYVYHFGRPLGSAMVSLIKAKGRVQERYEFVQAFLGSPYSRNRPMLRLQSLNIPLYVASFFARQDERTRAVSLFYALWSSVLLPEPRQVVAFRFIIAAMSDRYRILSVIGYIAFFEPYLASLRYIVLILPPSILALEAMRRIPLRILRSSIVPLFAISLAILLAYSPIGYYSSLEDRSERYVKEVHGNLIVPISPGYINGLLVPYRTYELLRVYDYYRLRGFLHATTLQEAIDRLLRLNIRAYVRDRNDEYQNSTSFEFFSEFPGALFLTDAFYLTRGLFYALVLNQSSLGYLLLYYVQAGGMRKYGCGLMQRVEDNGGEIAIITDLEIKAYAGGKPLRVIDDGAIKRIILDSYEPVLIVYPGGYEVIDPNSL